MSVVDRPTQLRVSSGYVADATGLRLWPLRRYWRLWAELEAFAYDPVEFRGRLNFRLILRFAGKKPTVLFCGPGGIGNLNRVVCLLRWMQEARPTVEGWTDPSIARLFAAAAAVRDWQPGRRTLTDEELLTQAQVHLAALQPDDVRRSAAALHERHSAHWLEAARLEIEADLMQGGIEEAMDTLATVLAEAPTELAARAPVAGYLLEADDDRGVRLAEAVCAAGLVAYPDVSFRLAWYLVRRKRWDDAGAVLARLDAVRVRLDGSVQQNLERAVAEIARLRRDPRAADHEVSRLLWRVRVRSWGPVVLALGCFLFPLVYAGPTFLRESWRLLALRDHGRRADLVMDLVVLGRDSGAKHFLAEIAYTMVPERSACDPLTLKRPEELQGDELRHWVALQRFGNGGAAPRGWYSGRTVLFDAAARAIQRDRALQYGTYLPENPAINTVGPITRTRIWLTWLGVPQVFLPGIAMVVIIVHAAVKPWYRRRWRRIRTGDQV